MLLHPVSYYSRQTTPAERNYHFYELETLHVVENIKEISDLSVKARSHGSILVDQL